MSCCKLFHPWWCLLPSPPGHRKALCPVPGGVVREDARQRQRHRRQPRPGNASRRDHVLVAVCGHLLHRRRGVLLLGGLCGRPEREVSDARERPPSSFVCFCRSSAQPFLSASNRVRGMLVINVLAVVAGLLMGLCRIWKPHIMVISGRFIMGFYCGTSHAVVVTWEVRTFL